MNVDENKAVELLNNHEIVALPTETVYGLAARFDSEIALKKIFHIKKRPSFDPLIVHISHLSQLEKLATRVSPAEEHLMDAFWPGPLTLVLPKRPDVSAIITSGHDTIAVRMPKNQVFHDIIQRTAPLAAPSANIFGHTSPTLAEHVEFEFGGALPIFDGGPCSVGIESTVVQITEDDKTVHTQVLRPGMISQQDLSISLKNYSAKKVVIAFGATAASPGHVQDHYQPRLPLIVARQASTWTTLLHKVICEKLNISESLLPASLSYAGQDPTLVARILYSDLRRLSTTSSGYIYLSVGDEFSSEDWRGIRDRIGKASSFSISEKDGQFIMHNKLENF